MNQLKPIRLVTQKIPKSLINDPLNVTTVASNIISNSAKKVSYLFPPFKARLEYIALLKDK